MMFLNIYIGFSILVFILTLMQTYVTFQRLKRKYPDDVNEFDKNNKSGILEKIFIYIKMFVTCFVPILNIGIFCALIFKSKEIEEETLNKVSNK